MKGIGLLLGFALLAACHPTSAGTATAAATTTDTSQASFTVGPLSESDINIQGCTTTLERAGGTDTVFAEDGVDTGAKGFIRIGGELINVGLTSASGDEKHATRNFADSAHTVAIVENLATGAAHEESDSVEQSGTIAVTYHNTTQTIKVDGGTAC